MEKSLFIPAYPSPNLNIEQSLGVNLLTNIQLTDYFLNSSTHTSDWLKDFSSQLPEQVINDLRLLRTVFAHGVILRGYYIKSHDHLNQDWNEFIGWWQTMPEEQVLELLIYGIRETMSYYYHYLPRMPLVEATMKDVSLAEDKLKDPENRHRAIKAVLESWSVEDTEDSLAFYDDLELVKDKIIQLIEGFWTSGFKELWEDEHKRLCEWRHHNEKTFSKSYRTNDEALLEVTGLYPDTNEMDQVKRAKKMTFIPVLNLGRLLTFENINQHMYVMFEPSTHTSKKEVNVSEQHYANIFAAFEGMGDRTRLQILGLLAENKAMFAQQIVNKLEMKQSTISRHLNQLHKSGLVSVRKEGNTKYFSIDKDVMREVINVLETLLK
ncbi:metalloregulator ArsR/SmtB family transcription factor [Lentibacillus sp.]|uniref:ArsR/SmtB family transcription factor n=1 Tax=Lentibacillus sp. TaxID=1925746 RepID=UPI002B4B48C3|nr:metalloregulator ArsR/SmtB family transcription factor [Lentibacillus sp.]HLS09804.1 metalloregulator ArsR/SmtB family transcription factor [Lentibacillus sp.]